MKFVFVWLLGYYRNGLWEPPHAMLSCVMAVLFLGLSLCSAASGNNANKVQYSKQSLFPVCVLALVYLTSVQLA